MDCSELFPQEKMLKLPPSDCRCYMFSDTNPHMEDICGCINRLLGFAEKQDVLDAEMLSRLRSKSYEQFSSAIHELAVAEFLSPIGDINWHPPGRNLRIGEFKIAPHNHEPIFIEVKTICDSKWVKKVSRNWDSIRKILHSVPSQFTIQLNFLELPCDVIPNRFRTWFERQVETLTLEINNLGQSRNVVFECLNNDGSSTRIMVEFAKLADYKQPTSSGIHWDHNKLELHKRVKEAVNKALRQLPDNKPNLVVVAPLSFDIGQQQMLAAMLSFPKVTIYQSTKPIKQEPTSHYDLQGIVQKSIRTRLSAVGVWHHKWSKDSQGSLDIYHNPLRAKEISHRILELPNVCQLIPKGVGTMEWVPNRPSQ